jgi:hypothetical protein
MKQKFLQLPRGNRSYLPKISSRRMGMFKEFLSAAYKSDGSTDTAEPPAEPTAEETEALNRIKGEVAAEFQRRGIELKKEATTEAAEKITATLKGLNLEALRNFDAKKIGDDVLKLSGEINKIKQMPVAGEQRMNAIRELLQDEATIKLMERAFDKRSGQVVTLDASRAAVAVMTMGNVVSDGDIPEDILNSFSVDAFIPKRRATEFIFNIVDRATMQEITEYKTWLEEGTEDGAFAIVAEGAVKPLVSKTLVRNVAHYQKVAGKRVYTEEFAKFRKEAYRILEQLFNDQLARNYAAMLVVNLNAAAASYVGTALDDQYANPTDYHAIGAVAAQIESLDFVPDILIMNPQDKWRIGLSADNNGAFYMNIPVYNPSGETRMMGFQLVTSNKVPVGQFYLGEKGLFKVEDEPVSVRMGYGINVTKDGNGFVTDVSSDVDTNRFRIIAEFFFRTYIGTNYAGSFVKASFATVKAALLKPAV